MSKGSKIFLPSRGLGYVSNHIPLLVRYIKSRKENLIVTCVGKSFHTYSITHFGLLSVSGLHPEDITCMAADAFHVYTACSNQIYAWRRGTELKHTYKGHKKSVHLLLTFGAHLISIDESNNLIVWNIKEETIHLEMSFSKKTFLITTLLHPTTYINKILLGSDQGALQLWNINSSKLIYTFKGWKSSVTCLEQAPAVDVVAIGLCSGKIILHNLKYDETVMEFVQDWGLVTSVTFRLDDHPIMATGSMSGHIVFWDLEEKRVFSQLLDAHDASVAGMICLPNEPLMVTSSPDNTLKLWIFDMTDGGPRLLRIREGHSSAPSYIRFHDSNGENILSSASDSTLRIFNTKTEQFNKSLGKASYNRKISKKRGRAVEDRLKMPPIVQFTSVTTREKEWDDIAAIHLGLPLVTTWSYDRLKMGELKLLPERFFKKNLGAYGEVTATCIALTFCGNFVLVGYSTGHADRFNMQSGIWREEYGNPKAHESPVRGITADVLNQMVITGSSVGDIKFWRFKNKGLDSIHVIQMNESISFFRCQHKSGMIAVALEDFSVCIIDMGTKQLVRKFVGHQGPITDTTFSSDSRWLISCSMDRSIRTWDIPSSQLIDQFSTEVAPVSIDLSPTGAILATTHVDYLGIFLWTNRTLYDKISLKALDPMEEPPLVSLPECGAEFKEIYEIEQDPDLSDFVSPEQLVKDFVTLSGLPTSRWQNLLNIDLVRKKNRPKMPPKVPKAAPFFLPTIPSLTLQFDLNANEEVESSKLTVPENLVNLTEFGKLLNATEHDFSPVIKILKAMGPSMIDFEIKSLAPEGGGTRCIMKKFLECLEFLLKSNRDFELAEAYLSVFLKSHGAFIASDTELRTFLIDIQSCHNVIWNRLHNKLFYTICVVQNLRTM